MKKIIKLTIRDVDGNPVSNSLVSCSVEEGYKKEFVNYWNANWKWWRVFVKINIGDEVDGDFYISYQDMFRTMSAAIAAGERYIQEYFPKFSLTVL